MSKKIKKTLRVTVKLFDVRFNQPAGSKKKLSDFSTHKIPTTDKSGNEIVVFFCEIPLPNKKNTTRFLKTIKKTYKEGIKVEIF